jgi:hypothetical protein
MNPSPNFFLWLTVSVAAVYLIAVRLTQAKKNITKIAAPADARVESTVVRHGVTVIKIKGYAIWWMLDGETILEPNMKLKLLFTQPGESGVYVTANDRNIGKLISSHPVRPAFAPCGKML